MEIVTSPKLLSKNPHNEGLVVLVIMANIFLYGTLCDLELLHICLGRSLDNIDKETARLDNHSVFWVKGRNFPVIKFDEGACAQGLVLFDLSSDDLNRLNFYEGSFNYELRKASIYIENKQLSDHRDMVEARVYFNTDEEIEVGDQKFERKDIEIGISDGVNVEIITGISQDDKIKVWNKTEPLKKDGNQNSFK